MVAPTVIPPHSRDDGHVHEPQKQTKDDDEKYPLECIARQLVVKVIAVAVFVIVLFFPSSASVSLSSVGIIIIIISTSRRRRRRRIMMPTPWNFQLRHSRRRTSRGTTHPSSTCVVCFNVYAIRQMTTGLGNQHTYYCTVVLYCSGRVKRNMKHCTGGVRGERGSYVTPP